MMLRAGAPLEDWREKRYDQRRDHSWGVHDMMTPEEIESRTRGLKTTWSADYAKGTALKALSSLTEAYAEIEKLKQRVHVMLDCNSFVREGRHWAGCPFSVADMTT